MRRAPAAELEIPTARDFLWALADVMGTRGLYVGEITRRLGVRSCRERVSRAGHIYSTLKALMTKGLMTYDTDGKTQGKYRITAAGLAAVDRSPVWAFEVAL